MIQFSATGTARPKKGAALSLALVVTTLCASAWAATFQHVASHTTSKPPAAAWSIMTDYDDTCNSGCKYYRPNLVKVVKLTYGKRENRWFTWSHVSAPVKDAKYFTEVTITWKTDGNFVANNRQLTTEDDVLIETLEKKTGLEHKPAFESGNTRSETTKRGAATVLTQTVTIETGFVAVLWAKRIREEMEKSVAATFKNIGK